MINDIQKLVIVPLMGLSIAKMNENNRIFLAPTQRYQVLKYYVFFGDLRIYSTLASLGFPSVCTQWQVKTQRLQQNWQMSEKSQHFKENAIFNEHPVYEV